MIGLSPFHDAWIGARSTAEAPPAPPGGGPGDPTELATINDIGYDHITLSWSGAGETWQKPWIIQRKKVGDAWVDPALDAPCGWNNFKWLGSQVNRYTDHDELEQNTTYYYRVFAVQNIRDVANLGSPIVYGTGHGNTVTTGTRTLLEYNPASYGSIDATGVADSYAAFKAAADAAHAAGGGIVNIPAGNFKLVLPTGDVQYSGGQLFVTSSGNAPGSWFSGYSHVEFRGQLDGGGNKLSKLTLRLWHDRPCTEYCERLKAGYTNPGDHSSTYVQTIRRGTFLNINGSQNICLRNLEIDGGALPVNSGKEWYSLDELRYQWDTSHKCIAGFTAHRNIKCVNVKTYNWRGEVFYTGGQHMEKWVIRDCDIRRTNSSSISMSSDLEMFGNVISDSANCGVESAIFGNFVSTFTGQAYKQNHLIWDNTIIGLDLSADGHMKNLPGNKNFAGLHVFQDSDGPISTVTGNTVINYGASAYGPYYGCKHNFLFRNAFKYPATPNIYACATFYLWHTSNYGISPHFSQNLWLDNHVHFNQSHNNGFRWMYSQSTGAEEDWIFDKLHFHNDSGGSISYSRFWEDTAGGGSGRTNVDWRNFTADAGLSINSFDQMFQTLAAIKVRRWPAFTNTNIFPRHAPAVEVISGLSVRQYLGYKDMQFLLYGQAAGSAFVANEIPNISLYPNGTVFTIKLNSYHASRGDSVTFPSAAAYNNFPSNQVLSNASQTLTVQTNAGKLDFVSLV